MSLNELIDEKHKSGEHCPHCFNSGYDARDQRDSKAEKKLAIRLVNCVIEEWKNRIKAYNPAFRDSITEDIICAIFDPEALDSDLKIKIKDILKTRTINS